MTRNRSTSLTILAASPPRALRSPAMAGGWPTPRFRRARCGAAARTAASACSSPSPPWPDCCRDGRPMARKSRSLAGPQRRVSGSTWCRRLAAHRVGSPPARCRKLTPRGHPTDDAWRSAARPAGRPARLRTRPFRCSILERARSTPLPGSAGFFSPRWSPDGRHIAALSLDSLRLVALRHGEQDLDGFSCPGGASYGWPSWSPDSTLDHASHRPPPSSVSRSPIDTSRPSSACRTDVAQGQLGAWLGATPDGWPVTTLDAGTHDIYALDWEAP